MEITKHCLEEEFRQIGGSIDSRIESLMSVPAPRNLEVKPPFSNWAEDLSKIGRGIDATAHAHRLLLEKVKAYLKEPDDTNRERLMASVKVSEDTLAQAGPDWEDTQRYYRAKQKQE